MQETTASLPARTIGLDVSDTSSSYCVISAGGTVLQEGSFSTTRAGLDEVLVAAEPSRVILEASTQTPWIARHIAQLGHEVIVANPRQLALISKSVRKTDRNDARTLARLGRVDPSLLSPVYQRDEKSLAVRTLLGARKQLVETRTRLIVEVRTACKVQGVRLDGASSPYFARKNRKALPALLHEALLPLMDVLEDLNEKIAGYDRLIEQLCEHEYPQTRLLRQVHGVGPQVALAFVTSIVDPRRFGDPRNVGAYVGLVPRSYQSGTSDPNLRISKQGDRQLRTLLVNAATHIMRRSSPDSALKRFGRRIASRGNPRDRARARIAVARKLAVLLQRLWLTGEVYEPLRGLVAKA
jgi:transposase